MVMLHGINQSKLKYCPGILWNIMKNQQWLWIVKTGAASFCFWQIGTGNLHLTFDTHTGGNGVQLGDLKIKRQRK